MEAANYCANYFRGFHEIYNYKINDTSTNACALLKIFSYIFIPIPLGVLAVYGLATLYGRVSKIQDLSFQDKNIQEIVKTNLPTQNTQDSSSKPVEEQPLDPIDPIIVKESPEVENQQNQVEDLNLFRTAFKIINCIKNLTIGAISSACILTPYKMGISRVASRMEPYQEVDKKGFLNNAGKYIDWLEIKNEHIRINRKAIDGADCPTQEIVNQLNSYNLINRVKLRDWATVTSFKTNFVMIEGIALSILEEFLFRGLLQDILLKRIPKYITKKIAPGKETYFDSTVAQALRIIVTAALFTRSDRPKSDHLFSHNDMDKFIMGIGLGILKESGGLTASLGANIADHLFTMIPVLQSC